MSTQKATITKSYLDGKVTAFTRRPLTVKEGTEADDILYGTTGKDSLIGRPGNDRLYGDDGDDLLSGGSDNDTLYGGRGDDTITGGRGDDTVILGVAQSSVSVTYNRAAGVFILVSSEGTDTISEVEFFVFSDATVSAAVYAALAGTPTGNVTISGAARQDSTLTAETATIRDADGLGIFDYQWFADGVPITGATASTLTLTEDELGAAITVRVGYTDGQGKYESLTSAATAAVQIGTHIQTSTTFVLPNNGHTTDLTLTGNNDIDGTGNALKNTIIGNSGNNRLDGGAGKDRMLGGAGDDTYVVDDSADRVYETTTISSITDAGGIDTVLSSVNFNLSSSVGMSFVENLTLMGDAAIGGTGNKLNNTLNGNSSTNKLSGGAGNDLIYGGSGHDSLRGEDGFDTLIGDAGNDVLEGGAGCDQLFGDTGRDVFLFRSTADTGVTSDTRDVIADFERGFDQIYLRDIDANTGVRGNQAFTFIGNNAFTGAAGELRFAADIVSGDINGDRIADFTIAVTAVGQMTAGDFVL